MYKKVHEGKAIINAPIGKKISRSLPVFYNPIMKFNRDISILILNSLQKKEMQICLPLAGTGVRGIRFIKELDKNNIKGIVMNDHSEEAYKLMKKNISENNVKIPVYNLDANQFLLESSGFDYIDIDPFGTPNPFLDSAVKRLSRGGILAVTATDTAPLCGTYPNACKRKYWGVPKHDELMYETGLRILIRKIQLIGAQYDKALIPIYSYFRHHYFRIFFKCLKGKTRVDKILKEHGNFNNAGPMWLGTIWDKKLAEDIFNKCNFIEHNKFLKIIRDESKIQEVGYFDLHTLVKMKKINHLPRKNELIEKLIENGHKASQTHFHKTALRSDLREKNYYNSLTNCTSDISCFNRINLF